MNDIKLTCRYWHCECDTNYIHPRTQEYCGQCGAVRTEQPNSRANEVKLPQSQPKPKSK